MFARYHGEKVPAAPLASEGFAARLGANAASAEAALATLKTLGLEAELFEAAPAGTPFDFMFPTLLADPANLLPAGSATIRALNLLGAAIGSDSGSGDGPIPAAYTYYGQFIDHDITKTSFDIKLGSVQFTDIIQLPTFDPLTPAQVRTKSSNARTGPLDLDSLYGQDAALGAGNDMALGTVTTAGVPRPIPTADLLHDLPRMGRSPDPALDRTARIGDPRNDENLIIAQLHVAFLRAHNALVKRGLTRAQAQRALRRRHQQAVIGDFLDRICDPAVLQDIRTNGPKFFKPAAGSLFVPVEFSGAAYRFGHSMVRQIYEHNSTFNSSAGALAPAGFENMFTFTALSGNINIPGTAVPPAPPTGFDTLPANWIIEWARFFGKDNDPDDASENPARRIDTRLAPELGRLPDAFGHAIADMMGKLASRNLLRGYLLGLPTGQAIAKHMGLAPVNPAAILAAVPTANGTEARTAFSTLQLHHRTPLWFYVLVEAGFPAVNGGPGGAHLGKVGSRIVAETLIALVKHAQDSVITDPLSAAEQADIDEFTLKGIVRLGLDTKFAPLP